MKLSDVVKKLPEDNTLEVKNRPYFNHSVEFKKIFSAKERAEMLEKVGLNVFFFPSEMVTGCDLLSDSGTSTMTNEQWASMHLGDESYGSNKGFFVLREQIRQTFGEEYFNRTAHKSINAFLFHQGRPCEDALFSFLTKLGTNQIIPSNGHFDTTRANIEANNINAINFFSSKLTDENSDSHFKGNMDLPEFKALLKKHANKIPLVYLTITNNTGGGQPVSMENIKEVSELAHSFNVPIFFDACRFAENAWFINRFEKGYNNKDVKDIVREMFSYVDGFTISFKKDGLANMGGGLFLKDKGLFIKKYPGIQDALTNHQIIKEGNPSYGGLSGRDIMALSVGLKTVTNDAYLTHRIKQVNEFGQHMKKKGIPVLTPVGGHAVYLDVNKFFGDTPMKPGDFGGISLVAILLAAYGHRACELGNFAFGTYDSKTGKERFPTVNFVRFAVPRLRYEMQDLEAVSEAVKILHETRHRIPSVKVIYGKELSLRHFKARFKFNS